MLSFCESGYSFIPIIDQISSTTDVNVTSFLFNLATRVVSAKAYPGLYTPPALGNLAVSCRITRADWTMHSQVAPYPTFFPFTIVVTLLFGGTPAFSGSTLSFHPSPTSIISKLVLSAFCFGTPSLLTLPKENADHDESEGGEERLALQVRLDLGRPLVLVMEEASLRSSHHTLIRAHERETPGFGYFAVMKCSPRLKF